MKREPIPEVAGMPGSFVDFGLVCGRLLGTGLLASKCSAFASADLALCSIPLDGCASHVILLGAPRDEAIFEGANFSFDHARGFDQGEQPGLGECKDRMILTHGDHDRSTARASLSSFGNQRFPA